MDSPRGHAWALEMSWPCRPHACPLQLASQALGLRHGSSMQAEGCWETQGLT